LDLYLLPRFGDRALGDIGRMDIDLMVSELRQTFAASTVRQTVAVLSSALTQAVDWQLIPANPAVGVKVRGSRPSSVIAPTLGDIHRLIDVANLRDPEMAVIILLAVDTGLRRQELAALRWADIDLDSATLICRHAIVKGVGGAELRRTKTGIVAPLALSEGSVAALERHRDHVTTIIEGTGYTLEESFVFGSRVSDPIYPDTITARFARIRREAHVGVEFRSLRHATATLLLSAGVDIRTVSGRLRHARTSTTLDRYADHVPAADRNAAATIDVLLDR
jgi:integrase